MSLKIVHLIPGFSPVTLALSGTLESEAVLKSKIDSYFDQHGINFALAPTSK
jgi:hypothetical protein